MISLLFLLMLLTFLLWIGFKVTGAVLLAFFWLFIKLPLGCLALALGLLFCCTLILIPLGIIFFKMSMRLIIPGI